MDTDFECDLSELLHTLTPEPPDFLATPRLGTPSEATRADAGTAVIELVPGTGHAPRRQHRWPALLAAAAVAALTTGILTVTLDNSGHPATHRISISSPVATTGTSTTANPARVPRCTSDQLVLGRTGFATHGHAGTARLSYGNSWAKRCALVLPVVAIGTKATGGTPFPASGATVRIPGHGHVAVAAHVRVSGRCQTVKRGLRINVTRGPFIYSFWLRVAGCTLTPLRLTHRVVR